MRISDWSSDVCSSDLIAWVNSHWLQIGIAVGVGLVIYILLSLARRFALKLAQSADGDMSFTHIAGRVLHKTKSTVLAIVAIRLVAGYAQPPAEIGRASCRERVCQSV